MEWDYEKNGALTPDQVSAGSAAMVHWKCQKFGHQWTDSPNHRTGRGSGCPYCGNKRVLVGFNDLETRFPEIAKEWDYERNDGLGPAEVLAGSARKVHWKCQKFGHHWEAIIVNRTRKGHGCSVCCNKQVLPGFNDLASQREDIAAEWD
ncbi:zinc-ribbon domain-containing protein [Nocardia tengchongensis]